MRSRDCIPAPFHSKTLKRRQNAFNTNEGNSKRSYIHFLNNPHPHSSVQSQSLVVLLGWLHYGAYCNKILVNVMRIFVEQRQIQGQPLEFSFLKLLFFDEGLEVFKETHLTFCCLHLYGSMAVLLAYKSCFFFYSLYI